MITAKYLIKINVLLNTYSMLMPFSCTTHLKRRESCTICNSADNEQQLPSNETMSQWCQ